MSDLIDEIFGETAEYYPGSKKRRQRSAPVIEFIADPWRENYTVKVVGGEERRMYTIGAFASALGVSVQTLRAWTRSGHLPQAPYRLPSNMIVSGENVAGRRLYTEALIDATTQIFERHDLLGRPRIVWADHPDVPIEVMEAWKRILSSN